MSKFYKALEPEYNHFHEWKIRSMCNSNKVGACKSRGKIFYIDSPEGKKSS